MVLAINRYRRVYREDWTSLLSSAIQQISGSTYSALMLRSEGGRVTLRDGWWLECTWISSSAGAIWRSNPVSEGRRSEDQ